jgi:hypothetical protein
MVAYRETGETHRDGERDRENANFNSTCMICAGVFMTTRGLENVISPSGVTCLHCVVA